MITREFVFAGRAIFTVSNDKGEWYTFKVIHGRYPRIYFAMVLSGPDNNRSYNGICNLTIDGKCIAELNPPMVNIFAWAIRRIWKQDGLPQGYDIRHAGHCGRCGRLLTTPESIESGFGPTCIAKGK